MSQQHLQQQPAAGSVSAWHYHHTGVVVRNIREEIARYETLLGYHIDFEVYGMTEQFQHMVGVPGLSCDLVQLVNPVLGHRIELLEVHGVSDESDRSLPIHPGMSHTAYLVPNIQEAANEVTRQGGRLLDQLVVFAEGVAGYFQLPGGSTIELEELTSESNEGGTHG